jgi:hypothetical protein
LGVIQLEPIHKLNGNLLECLKRLFAPIGIDWEEWIVNVIMLSRQSSATYSIELRTSATLYHGKPYYSSRHVDEHVTSLDAAVPLIGSYAGYCLHWGAAVWVDRINSLPPLDPLAMAYRSFEYVGISAPPPIAEYVFPIRVKTGLTEVLVGVLNLEWYGNPRSSERRQTPFQNLRGIITAELSRLLDLHGSFMGLALAVPELIGKEALSVAFVEKIEEAQISCFEVLERGSKLEQSLTSEPEPQGSAFE